MNRVLVLIASLFLFAKAASIDKDGESTELTDDGVTWGYVPMDDFIGSLNGLVMAGVEGKGNTLISRPQYICRVWRENVWTPGKLILVVDTPIIHAGPTCFIVETSNTRQVSVRLTHEDSNDIQLLKAPSGWTSWVPHKPFDALPTHFVSGGLHITGEKIPICRAQDEEGYVHVGKYWQNASECIYSQERIHRERDSVEILVLSPLGQKMHG